MAAIYCSITQVRYQINSGGKGVTTAILSDADVTFYIERAQSIIDSYLVGTYTVPFTALNVPTVITTVCTDLATFFCLRILFTRDSRNSDNVDTIKEMYYDIHIDEKNIKNGTLGKIKQGELLMIDSSGNISSKKVDSVKSTTKDYTPTFDVDDAENWTVDEERLEAISDER